MLVLSADSVSMVVLVALLHEGSAHLLTLTTETERELITGS
jgi:hypothetical protein